MTERRAHSREIAAPVIAITTKKASALESLAFAVIAIGALYFARNVFVPLALAVLLSFALVPVVLTLRRWHLGRIPAVIATVLLAFGLIFAGGSLIGTQLAHLADNLPGYQSNITNKIHILRGSVVNFGFSGASGMLKHLNGEINGNAPEALAPKTSPVSPRAEKPSAPIAVEIHRPEPTALEMVQSIMDPLLQPLATVGTVAVLVIFFLLQREDLRGRFIRLAGGRDFRRATHGLDDAAQRVSSYLLTQTAINAAFGLLIGGGLWLIGVPNPALWGLVSMLLRYVPYFGAFIAVVFPAVLAIAVDPGWSMLIWTGVLFVIVESVIAQVIEPQLYSKSTGLSGVAIVVAATFWTWLWGPVGLLLSTPLTLCLVVLGRHVEGLKFLEVILGDRPALLPEENFYQRILANDSDEVAQHAETFLKTRPLTEYYDEIAIRGLALAQVDVNRGVLVHDERVRIKRAVIDVINELSDHIAQDKALNAPDKDPSLPRLSAKKAAETPAPKQVMCIAGRGSLDETAAAMLAQLLESRHIGTQVVPTEAASSATIATLEAEGIDVICLSYLEPGGLTNAKYLVRRLRRNLPEVQIILGFWTWSDEDLEQRNVLGETGADAVVTSLTQAFEMISGTLDLRNKNVSLSQLATNIGSIPWLYKQKK